MSITRAAESAAALGVEATFGCRPFHTPDKTHPNVVPFRASASRNHDGASVLVETRYCNFDPRYSRTKTAGAASALAARTCIIFNSQ